MQRTFETLSAEIILKILKHLSLTDILAMEIVCKKFYGVMRGQYGPAFWQTKYNEIEFVRMDDPLNWMGSTKTSYFDTLRRVKKKLAVPCNNNDLLISLIANQHCIEVNQVIKLGYGVNRVDGMGRTALYMAAKLEQNVLIQALVRAGAEVDRAFMFAIVNQDVRAVYRMINAGVIVRQAVLLECAKLSPNPAMLPHVESTLSIELWPTKKSPRDFQLTALIFSILHGDMRCVAHFSYSHQTSWHKDSLVKDAIRTENWNMIIALAIGDYVFLNHVFNEENFLMLAARKGATRFAENVISLGINLDFKNVKGQTALDIAKEHQHWPVAYLILNKLLMVYIKDRESSIGFGYFGIFMHDGEKVRRKTAIAKELITILQNANHMTSPYDAVSLEQFNFRRHDIWDGRLGEIVNKLLSCRIPSDSRANNPFIM